MMLSRSAWIVPTALTVVFSLLFINTGLRIFVGLTAASLVVLFFALWHDFKPRDKYNLVALRELEDKKELESLDPSVGVLEFEDYLCPYCRTEYSSELRKCPRCGRTRTSSWS